MRGAEPRVDTPHLISAEELQGKAHDGIGKEVYARAKTFFLGFKIGDLQHDVQNDQTKGLYELNGKKGGVQRHVMVRRLFVNHGQRPVVLHAETATGKKAPHPAERVTDGYTDGKHVKVRQSIRFVDLAIEKHADRAADQAAVKNETVSHDLPKGKVIGADHVYGSEHGKQFGTQNTAYGGKTSGNHRFHPGDVAAFTADRTEHGAQQKTDHEQDAVNGNVSSE